MDVARSKTLQKSPPPTLLISSGVKPDSLGSCVRDRLGGCCWRNRDYGLSPYPSPEVSSTKAEFCCTATSICWTASVTFSNVLPDSLTSREPSSRRTTESLIRPLISYFRRNYRKATTLFAGTRRFHCRIESQQIRLKSDFVDDSDDIGDAVAGIVNSTHGRNSVFDYFAPAFSLVASAACQDVCLTSIVGVLLPSAD